MIVSELTFFRSVYHAGVFKQMHGTVRFTAEIFCRSRESRRRSTGTTLPTVAVFVYDEYAERTERRKVIDRIATVKVTD